MVTCPMIKSKEEGKDHESIQSSTTPDPGHHMGNGKSTRKYHTQESQEVSPFTAGDHKAARLFEDNLRTEHFIFSMEKKYLYPLKLVSGHFRQIFVSFETCIWLFLGNLSLRLSEVLVGVSVCILRITVKINT